jgi:fibronectin-binding autotransporter adhesin
MGRVWGNWGVGFAVGALIASLPAFADTNTFTVASGQTQTQAGQITDDTTAVNVVVTGGGALTLSNATNSYTGGTTVNGGSTLQVTADGNLGAAAGGITLGDSTVPTTGATAANAGTLDLSTSPAAVTSARALVINAGGGTILAGANPWTLSGVLSGSGALTLTGGGTLVLSGANTYSGALTIDDGTTLKVTAATNLGPASLTLGDSTTGGTLDLTGSTAAVAAANAIALAAGGGTIVLAPTTAYSLTLSGVISGTGHLTVEGTGLLIPSGTNTYTGGTTIAGGATVEISTDANLGASGSSVTLGDATTTGALQLASASAVTSALNLSLASGGGIIDVSSDPWTITNGITGTGGLTLTGTGTLILEGVNTYAGATTVNSGTLELGSVSGSSASLAGNVTVAAAGAFSGFGTVLGNVTNNGLLGPGHSSTVGTLTVGSFNQSAGGTLVLEVTPTGASELKVVGAADLGGTLKLVADGQLNATTYHLITAGSVSNTFATINDPLSAALSAQITYLSTGVDLTITQLNTLPETPTVYAALKSTEVDGAQGANTTILSHLTGIRTGAAVDQMQMVNSSTHKAGDSTGASPYGAWAQAQGGFGSTNGGGGAPGYDAHGGGFLAGIDGQIGKGGVLGFAVGYDVTSVSENGGASGTIDAPRVAVYGGWWLGPVALDGSVGVGVPSLTSNRPVTQTNTTATASYVGTEVTAAFQASSTMSLGQFALTPAVGVEYARLKLRSFSEDGAAGYDLDGPQNTTDSLRPFLAATASTRFFYDARTVLEPTLRVAYAEEVMSNSRQVTVEPAGDNATFLFEGVKPSRGEGSVDAGLTVETSHDLGFFTDAAVVGIGNVSGVKLDAGVRYRF